MGCECTPEPGTEGPFEAPFTRPQEPDTIAIFAELQLRKANSSDLLFRVQQ